MAINDYLISYTTTGNTQIVSLTGQATVAGPTLVSGRVTAPPLLRSGIAYFGEGGISGTGQLPLYAVPFRTGDLSQGSNLWTGATSIQVSGSIDATPVILGSTLYIASSMGYVSPVGIADPKNPSIDFPVNIVGLASGQTTKVTNLLASPVSQGLILVTAQGVYNAEISGGTLAAGWTALSGVDLSGQPALLMGTLLVVASSNTLYAIDLSASPAGGVMPTTWSYTFDTNLVAFQVYPPNYVLAVDSDGYFYVLLSAQQMSMPRVQLSPPSTQAAQISIGPNTIIAAGTDGSVGLWNFSIGTGTATAPIQVTPLQGLQAFSASFAAAPLVSLSQAIVIDTSGRVFPISLLTTQPTLGSPISVGAALVAATNAAWGVAVESPSSAQVRFLLDGSQYFPVLRNLLIAAAQNNLVLSPSISSTYDSRFDCLIKSVAASASTVDIYVMMWAQSLVQYQFENWSLENLASWQWYWGLPVQVAQELLQGPAFRGDRRLSAQTQLSFSGIPNIHTFLEDYPGPSTPGYWVSLPVSVSSTHQKIVIVSVNGTKFALVSGFNLITPSYYDTPAHTMTDASGTYSGESWHDTGVLLQGNVVDDIEAHFDRRFSKSGTIVAPSSNTYVKISNWMIARSSCLDTAVACAASSEPCGTIPPGSLATPYSNPTLSGASVPVTMAITENDWTSFLTLGQWTRLPAGINLYQNVTQIRDGLIGRIAAARSWLYFENFAFFDPVIVNALVQAQQANASLKLVVAVPYPNKAIRSGLFSAERPDSRETAVGAYLTAKALLILKLAAGEYTDLTCQGTVYQAVNITNLSIDINPKDLFYSTMTFNYNGSTTATTLQIALITAMTEANSNPRVMFCSPVRRFSSDPTPGKDGGTLPGYANTLRAIYVHSKLALIDDAVALIGSANFNRRSMEGDEELSVFISDAATVASIRQALFTHWNMNTISTWWTDMQTYVSGSSLTVGMVPLLFNNSPQKIHQTNWWYLSSVCDPSFFH